MGKSSAKKVARAARAGGRSASTRQRNLMFPAILLTIFLGGSGLITFAALERKGDETVPPIVGDHWHAAYGFYVCDEYRSAIDTFENPAGIHTHGDGLFHIHPFSNANAGENATIGAFLDVPDVELSDDKLEVGPNVLLGDPEGFTLEEGEDQCNGEDAELMVAHWPNAQSEQNPALFRTDLDDIRFRENGEVFAIAFVPEDTTEIPMPDSVNILGQVTGELAPDEGGHGGGDAPADDADAGAGGQGDAGDQGDQGGGDAPADDADAGSGGDGGADAPADAGGGGDAGG